MDLKDFQKNRFYINSELIFDISNAIISFSDMVKRAKSSDIYSGVENIPFQEREHDYKRILKQEFVTA